MLINRIIIKLINEGWSRKHYNKPANYVEIDIYDTKDGEMVEFELYRGCKNPKPIGHVTISKKQLRTVLQMNDVLKQSPAEPTTKPAILPDAKGKSIDGGVTCGLNRPR